MSEFREYIEPPDEVLKVQDAAFRWEQYHNISYSSLYLAGPGFDDTVDQDCSLQPLTGSSYWPGGVPHLTDKVGAGIRFATVSSTNIPESELNVSNVRDRILSLRLSRNALTRWNDHKRNVYQELGENVFQDEGVEYLCAVSEAPFALVSILRVHKHKKVKAGSPMALLHFPANLNSPNIALKALQDAQQEVIDQETLLTDNF